MDKHKIIVIIGPNASGKSDLGVYLARKLDGEIISADSRQVYKWMNIGTGKITKKEMKGVPHHLLNIAHPSRQFTVVQFKKYSEEAIKGVVKKGKIPIIVGGTGFYINSLIYDINLPEVGPNKKLRGKLRGYSTGKLYKMLHKKDPERARNIEGKNKRKLIRALEVIEATGKKIPKIKRGNPYDLLLIGITYPKEKLHKRIEKRLYARFKQGMIKEVKELREVHRVSWERLEKFGLEYKWIALYLQDKITKNEMRDNLLRDIKKYARRQMTWFKRNEDIIWIKNKKEAEKLVKEFLR